MNKPNVIRVGDQVRIVNPLMFIRCGYPLGIEDGKRAVEHKREAVRQLFDYPSSPDCLFDYNDAKSEDKILRVLAVKWLYSQRFGGRERTIHTVLRPDLKGVTMEVSSIKTVMTGYYVPGCSGGGYFDEGDPEPPDLSNRKTHRILEGFTHSVYIDSHLLMIESVHIEKLL